MSRCLTDDEIQALADREAGSETAAHVEQCQRCNDRLAARVRLIARTVDAAGTGDLPPSLHNGIRAHVASPTAEGATTLRPVVRGRRFVWMIPLAAAVVIAFLVRVIPHVDRQTTVSAAEILGRSRTALAAPTTGIEILTYDLDLAGVLADLVPEEQAGRFTVREVVDHDHEGRYRVVKLTSSGQIVGGAADDPLRGTRTRYMRANGRGYLLKFDGAEPAAFSIPAIKRTILQTFIGFMQASSTQTLREVQRGNDACYEIDIPGNAMAFGNLVALDSARAVVTAADSRLVEFSATGRMADRPFMVEFLLRSQELRPANSAADGDFDIAPQPGDVVLHGNASSNAMWDVVTRALGAIPADAGGARQANPGATSRQ
jgi:hypothetical protein